MVWAAQQAVSLLTPAAPYVKPRRVCLRLTPLKVVTMHLRAYWREAFLASVMAVSISILLISAFTLQGLTGLVTIAAGVFVGVLGIGMYDTWYDQIAKTATKAKIKAKR